MLYSDACVYPYPSGDTTIRRLALEARYLGYGRVVCIGCETSGEYYGVSVLKGCLIHSSGFNDFRKILKKECRGSDVIAAYAGDASFNRSVISSGKVNILKGIERCDRRAFDDVSARYAADKGVAMDIDLSAIISKSGYLRQKALTVYGDILKFSRKYGFMLTISSGARSYPEMKGIREVENICSLFGMSPDEVRRSLTSIERILNPPENVEVISV
ncbi:RNase P subunit p30 family protein [Methanoplanus endosymbiosus]|uniref:Ribonuclease P protein component 3 n=1 Tax=Methanoplanus endosymbiosus TaxID=33865 RepID=A0A9E7PKU6_9EURY|nr:RNase P subunit p30 family protein [Methanoplanus endosymbiosus]UUX92018.1 ribonuclease P [Methanoplanus endosymbiosus]